jgi:hypothetical protein
MKIPPLIAAAEAVGGAGKGAEGEAGATIRTENSNNAVRSGRQQGADPGSAQDAQ